MRKRKKEEKKGAAEWLTTYSDMVTLLLCFFVLLFSFSNIDAQKFRSIMSSFQGGAGVLQGGTAMDIPENLAGDYNVDEDELEKLKGVIEEYAESIDLENKITLTTEERGLVIRFADSVFFDSGKADIKPESKKILHYVAELLNRNEFKEKQIKVEGHTDSDPIYRSITYPTNWELSAIRATNVLRYLVEVESIDGERISSSGYSYYRPIAPNDTKENKAKNRRVDIVILRTSEEALEP
ncbi:flagellar motor protein MotB [Anaerosalibacter sp. Marseille-P3206]|uniref:flagellar motor protein MotB n=1 Tax=Anaerosalibacter sp. Marseille-P3206 TaxID=1871005 RepID=UPI000987A09A|nr:flagellar motor protein MotB [Anaerosalibacter sp. Marseille-P3206]